MLEVQNWPPSNSASTDGEQNTTHVVKRVYDLPVGQRLVSVDWSDGETVNYTTAPRGTLAPQRYECHESGMLYGVLDDTRVDTLVFQEH